MNAPRFNPFPGLRSFWTHEKHLFFGRETQTAEMLERLGATRFLAAVGPSGSGKSSLVRAGLIPELIGGTNTRVGSRWVVLVFRPGSDPLMALATALAESELYGTELEEGAEQVAATLRRSARGLVEAVRQANAPTRTNVLIVVDQFEELFRFASARTPRHDAADAFVNLLLEASRSSESNLFVVLTMRSDFIGDCARFTGLAEAINRGQYLIPRLTRDQWRSAIEGPVRVGGGSIAPRLVQRLLNDVADDPDQLPVLQHALMRTWDNWVGLTPDNSAPFPPLDLVHYEAVGGMAEALSRHAEEALAELPDEPHRLLAGRLFKALTEKGADGRGVRRPARFDVLLSACGASAPELERVAGVFRSPGRTFILPGSDAPLQADTILDISHESLMRVWSRLRDWVEAEAQSAGIYRRLTETATLWQQGSAGLYRDPELAVALRWRETDRPTEGWGQLQRGDFANALRFLEESASAARREREEKEAAQRRELEQARQRAAEQARRARLYRWVAAVMALLVVIIVRIALELRQKKNEAVAREKEAVSRELAMHAANQLEVDPELSLILAREAMNTHPSTVTEEMLRQALFASHVRWRLGQPKDGALNLAETSSDGARIVTAGEGGTARLWNATNGTLLAVLSGHSAGINAAQFSSRGLLVTASDDGTARLWSARDGHKLATLAAGPASVRSAEFSADGSTLLTANQDGLLQLWFGDTWTNSLALPSTNYPCHGATFSPSGDRIVAFGESGGSRLLTLRPTPSAQALSNAPENLTAAIFGPDGETFATASAEGAVDLWDGHTGVHLATLDAASPLPEAVALAFGHRQPIRLLSAHKPPSGAKIHNRVTGQVEKLFSDYSGNVRSGGFSPDDEFAVTAGEDKTAHIWGGTEGRTIQALRGHQAQINQVRFSPDGRWVITASADGTARVWSVATGVQTKLPVSVVSQNVFSEDGHWGFTLGARPGGPAWRWSTVAPATPELISSNVSRFTLSGDGRTAVLFRMVDTTSDEIQIWREGSDRKELLPTKTTRVALPPPALNYTGTRLLWISAQEGPQYWKLGVAPARIPVASTDWVGPMMSLGSAAFSPNDRWLAAVTRNTNVLVWDLPDFSAPASESAPRLFRRISRPSDAKIKSVLISPDSRILLTINTRSEAHGWLLEATDRSEPLWELAHASSINGAAFSADSRFVVTASSDSVARIWSTQTGRLIATLRGESERLVAAAFVTANTTVVTVGEKGMVRTFAAEGCGPTTNLLKMVVSRNPRDLSPEERKQYFREPTR